MSTNQTLLFIFLAAIWGASFLFMRVASPEFGPFSLILVRTVVAALCLIPFVRRKQWTDIWDNKHQLFFIALFSTAIPYTLVSFATLYLSSGITSILNALTPIFTSFFALFMLNEKPTTRVVMGVTFGFIGVIVVNLERLTQLHVYSLTAVVAAIAAPVFYAYSSCYLKSHLQGINNLAIVFGCQVFASLWLTPFALWQHPGQWPSVTAWLNALALGALSTALAVIIFFYLIRSTSVTKAISVTFLIPVFTIIWAFVFLKENPSVYGLVGGLCILFGVALNILKPKK